MSCSGCLFYGETGGYEVKDFLENISDVKERLDLVVCTVNVDISIDAL